MFVIGVERRGVVKFVFVSFEDFIKKVIFEVSFEVRGGICC